MHPIFAVILRAGGLGTVVLALVLAVSCILAIFWSIRAVWRAVLHRNPKRTRYAIVGFLFLSLFAVVRLLDYQAQKRAEQAWREKLEATFGQANRAKMEDEVARRKKDYEAAQKAAQKPAELPRIMEKSKFYSLVPQHGWRDISSEQKNLGYDLVLVSIRGEILIETKDVKTDVSAQTLMTAWKQRMTNIRQDAAFVDLPPITLAQSEWLSARATYASPAPQNIPYVTQCYLTVHEGKACGIYFVATAAVFEKGLTEAKAIIDTFRFESSGTPR